MSGISGFDVIGVIGTAFIIVAYFATQQGWVKASDWRFPLANLVGAMLILVSLWADWNLPSFVMEIFWLAISLYGLWRSRLRA
jgi:hypothetical protein